MVEFDFLILDNRTKRWHQILNDLKNGHKMDMEVHHT